MTAHGPEPAFAGRLARRLPFFYGWVIVSISFLCVFLMGATTYWGLQIFIAPMHEDTGWSHTSIVAGLFVRFIAGAVVGFLLGHLADRRNGARNLLLIGTLIDGAAMAALYWVESPAQFILLYGVIGGAGNAGLRLFQATLIPKWFLFRRGAAFGLSTMGGGVSALIMVPLIAFMIEGLGWRSSWPALAAIMLVAVLPCVPLAVRAPEDVGLLPDNGAPPPSRAREPRSEPERSYTLGEALRTWRFWFLILGMTAGSYALGANTFILVPYFREVGFSAAVAASAISVYGFASFSTRLVWGTIADRFSVRPALVIQALLTAVGAALLLQIAGRATLYGAAAFQGAVLSGFPTLQGLVWPEFFGRRHIGAIIGLTSLFGTFASASGPLIAGIVFDSTGTYESSIWAIIAAWAACGAVILAVRPGRARPPVAEVALPDG